MISSLLQLSDLEQVVTNDDFLIRNNEISRFLQIFKNSRKHNFFADIKYRDHDVRGYGQGFRDHISMFRHAKNLYLVSIEDI